MGFLTTRTILLLAFAAAFSFGAQSGRRAAAPSETYLFPTDASHRINSGFADYRASHFHGGIDISTNGKIGYPVFASKSGYVYRVSVSPFGYGKMIILRHDDSTYTLYGHLSAFSSDIERLVDSVQHSDSSYGVDLELYRNEIMVTRGEQIARTGATGVGGPHLHFEIHGRDYSFIDPLIYKSINVTRYRTPKIFGIMVRGYLSGKTVMRRIVRRGKSLRELPRFQMKEPFYFIVHAADSYGRRRFKRPPKRIFLKIDGKEFVSVDLTRFNHNEYLDVRSLVDVRVSHGYETYYRLCVDRAIPFPIISPDSSLSGIVDCRFKNGKHTYRIIVEDENGDAAYATGSFELDIPRETKNGDPGNSCAPVPMERFTAQTLSPISGLTLRFPNDCFDRKVKISAVSLSENSFRIKPGMEHIRRPVQVLWKVDDPKLQLFRKGRRSWIHISSSNNGKILTAKITYETGTFALLRDDVPPAIGRVRASSLNPFYNSVAPRQFNRVFVYFRMFDKLSGINTNRILLKIGRRNYLCEYDVDKHSAICQVDRSNLSMHSKIEVIAYDNAGNETRVYSTPKFRR